jgi:hypothetical protein
VQEPDTLDGEYRVKGEAELGPVQGGAPVFQPGGISRLVLLVLSIAFVVWFQGVVFGWFS